MGLSNWALYLSFTVLGVTAHAPFQKPSNTVRIPGGRDADVVKYQVSMQVRGSHMCGGWIYNKNTIVTAASCLARFRKFPALLEKVRFIIGGKSLGECENGEQSLIAKEIVIHPEFSMIMSHINDIAIVRTETEIRFNDFVGPISVSTEEFPDKARVTGWGYTKARSHEEYNDVANLPLILQEANITVFDNEKCIDVYLMSDDPGYVTLIESGRVLCAGVPEGGVGVCQGDTGGPLACYSADEQEVSICGIVSIVSGCALPQFPAIFTRVSVYADWLEQHAA